LYKSVDLPKPRACQTEEERADWSWDGDVPADCIHEGQNLGRWVSNHRTAYKNEKLLDDRKQKLEAAGLKWGERKSENQAWEEKFQLLLDYINYIENQGPGAKWVRRYCTDHLRARGGGAW
jgi:hypothetical protein